MSSIPEQKQKVQTNLKLTAERAMALDIAAAIEQKDKARIVEEALALREGCVDGVRGERAGLGDVGL